MVDRILISVSFCRHSGNQGTTGRPATAHYNFRKIPLRTRLSKPGEALMPGEVSTRIPSGGDHAKGLARPPASRGFSPPQASSVPATERTWALRPCRVSDAPKRADASAVVAVSVYKAVNKAAPSKGGPRLATLVIRGASAAADGEDVTAGHSKAPAAPAHRPGWTVAFPALVTPLPAMDLVHGLHLYRASCLLLRRYVVSLPAKTFGG